MRIDLLSQDDIFLDKMTREIAGMLDINTDLIQAVINSIVLYIMRNIQDQYKSKRSTMDPSSNRPSVVTLKIPKILDLTILCSTARNCVEFREVHVHPEFQRLVKSATLDGIDLIQDELKSKASIILTDRYIKLMREVFSNEQFGFDVQ